MRVDLNYRLVGMVSRVSSIQEVIPDVRDGLTRTERLILYLVHETRKERGGRNVPTVMLYGRVLEYVDMSEAELHVYLDRLGVRGDGAQPAFYSAQCSST